MDRFFENKKHIKIAIASLLAIILVQFTFIICRTSSSTENQKDYVVNLVTIEDSLNYSEVKSNLENVDQVIKKLSTFFASKNVKVPHIEALKSEKLTNGIYLSKQTERYSYILEKYHNEIKKIPIGSPVGGYISSPFGTRKNPFSSLLTSNAGGDGPSFKFHSGIDFAVPIGTEVKSTADGKVIFAGRKGGYGNAIIVRHKNGLATLYGHLSKILVKPNEEVEAGDVIAKSGNTGNSTGPHVHYEVRKNNRPINPRSYIKI